MTLILTAICQNGIAICADKRRTVKTNCEIRRFDNLNKIFRFSDSRTLAYNHAINRIVGADWRTILQEFQEIQNVGDFTCSELVKRFKDYANDRVNQELNQNKFDDSVGFVFCTVRPVGKPEAHEVFWKRGKQIEMKSHRGLIRSGEGAKYLNNYISQNPATNTVEYWQGVSVKDAVFQLSEMFTVASATQQLAGGREFSASYDTDTIAIPETA